MKRLFVAIELPPKVRAIVVGAKALLEHEVKDARWVSPENVHLTLKFLGNCQNEQVEEIAMKLREGLSGCAALTCETNEFGAFPAPKKARILWLGMEEKPELRQIYNRVNSSLRDIGFESEERAFHPHITLARLKHPMKVDIETLGSKIDSRQVVQVEAVTLFASHLSPRGALYESLAKIDLLPAKG